MKKHMLCFLVSISLVDGLLCTNELGVKLLDSIKSGRIEDVKTVLENGADINFKGNGGRTALHIASMLGFHKIAEFLIVNGADVNLLDDTGASAIHLALKWFGRDEVIKKLLAAGANPNFTDKNGVTPLFQAIASNNTKIVRLLISYGADDLDFILDLAIRSRNLKMLETCFNCGSDVNKKDKFGKSVLQKAVTTGDVKVVELVLRFGASACEIDGDGVSPLRIATRKGFSDIVSLLIKNSASLGDVDKMGNSLLHDAVWYGKDAYDKEGHRKTVELLVINGVFVNVRDGRDRTPLHIAAICGSPEITKTLLEYGAEKDVFDNAGNRPINYAREYKIFGVYAEADSYEQVIKALE